jgi:hypothetical protein
VTAVDLRHLQAQAWRFARITVLALAGQLLVLGHWPGWAGLWALLLGAVETTLRQLYPTVSIYDAPAPTVPPSRTGAPGGGGGQ